jgi:hypothetical protein
LDSETGKPIGGVRILVENTNRGTYSSPSGFFRLGKLTGGETLKFTSLAYNSKSIKLEQIPTDTLYVRLKPAPIQLEQVEKVGEITADEIVRRAIQKKKENLSKIQTLQSIVYSKLTIELGGALLERAKSEISKSGNLSISVESSRKNDSLQIIDTSSHRTIVSRRENPQIVAVKHFILETFSNLYADYSKGIKVSEITQRRQTANIPPEANIVAFNEFFNFFDETLTIMNAQFVTPLAENAFDFYRFELLGRTIYGDYYVYDIRVTPTTTTFPTFIGNIKIIEGSYNLVEIDLTPSRTSAISMVDSLRFVQKFHQIDQNYWQPTYLQINAKLRIAIVKGWLDLLCNINGTSIVSDAKINSPLPDSIYAKYSGEATTVDSKADSTGVEFWENNSLREITLEEKELYAQIDTAMKSIDSLLSKNRNASFGYGISLENLSGFNRVVGYSADISPYISFRNLKINLSPFYSSGLKKAFGEAIISYRTSTRSDFPLNFADISFKIFSKVETISNDKSVSPTLNSLAALLFHWDYYDYYRKDGFRIDYGINTLNFKLNMGFEEARHFSLRKTTDKSAFSTSPWRENPEIQSGSFRSFILNLETGNFVSLPGIGTLSGGGLNYKVNGKLTFGAKKGGSTAFAIFESSLLLQIPTFYTGYSPMNLSLLFQYGRATETTPLQYLFRMPSGFGFGNFYSARIGLFGGQEYFAMHLQYNLTDIWWRAIGLPRYEGRGLDLLLSASFGKFNGNSGIYNSTDGKFYTEIGFGFSRIPTFFSNVLFWGFEFRFGLPPLGRKRWGWNYILSLPF